jgi:hypothetical protein
MSKPKRVTNGIKYNLTKRSDSRYYQLSFTDPRPADPSKAQIRLSTESDTLAGAEAFADDYLMKYVPGQPKNKLTVADLIAATLQHKANHQKRDHAEKSRNWELRLRDKFGSWDHRDLTADVLEDYKSWCLGAPVDEHTSALRRRWTPIQQTEVERTDKRGNTYSMKLDVIAKATINLDLALLSKAYRDANRKGLITYRPWIRKYGKKELPRRTGTVALTEFDAVMALDPPAPVWLRGMIHIYNDDGNRASELRKVKVGAYQSIPTPEGEAGLLQLDASITKTQHGRTVPLSKAAHELVKQCIVGKGADEYLFTRDDLGKGERQVLDFRKTWVATLLRAGITRKILLHDFRRTSVGDFEEAQVSRGTGMSISGHIDPGVYNDYNVQNKKRLIEAMRTKEAWQEEQRRLMSGLPQAPAMEELMAAMQLQIEEGLQREGKLSAQVEVLKSVIKSMEISTDLAH